MDKKHNRHFENGRHRYRPLGCLLLALFLLASSFPVSAAGAGENVIRVGWYEDSYHITGENGERSGYGYEYEQAVAAYTGWKYEYVKGDWAELLGMLQNGEIDMMAALSQTEERAETMLFSEFSMGEEKYYLYADLSGGDVSASDLSTLNGKRVVVMEDSIQGTQFAQWETKHNIQTKHKNLDNFERAIDLALSHEIDGVVSTETPAWVEAGMSAVATVGGSDIYFGISKSRPDIKEALDTAMQKMEYDKPFYSDELYRRYLSSQSVAVLSGEEKAWLAQHGDIRVGFLVNDPGVSALNAETAALTGVITDYITYATDCLGEGTLSFQLTAFDTAEEQIEALKNGSIDVIFHVSQNPSVAEKNDFSLSNTVLSFHFAAITPLRTFDESEKIRVAVPKECVNLKWFLSYRYPEWEIVEYDTLGEVEKAVRGGEADCFFTTSGFVSQFIQDGKYRSFFLTQPGDASFAVRRGDATLLSILNKTLKSMPNTMLTGALSMYESTGEKVTLTRFLKDNLPVVSATFISVFVLVLCLVLSFLGKARESARRAQALNAELEKSQVKLREALSQAEEANSAKTTFLFNMSHDIRTPMNAILGFATLAEKTPGNPQPVQEYLQKIQVSGRGMLSILNNVLELSRIESGKITLEESPQEAGKAFDACMVMMNPDIERKHHTITSEKNIRYPYIYFDATRITEILINVLSNAIKYTSDGGTIHCTLNQYPSGREGWLIQEVIVADNGIGMSEEYQKHMFETFSRERSTTQSGIQGTGLGMGIVKKLIDLMDGTIQVKSRPGEGTTVTLRIPLRIASYEDTQAKPSTTGDGKEALKGKRVLLAEDNDLNAEIAIALLTEEGILVDRASDGVQCIEKLERCAPGYYALILMDVQMPNLDGCQAAEKIRKLRDREKASIPMIAMTANAFSEDKAKVLAAGMNDHVAKPIDMNVLNEVMLKYIR